MSDRNHLTAAKVDKLTVAAKGSRRAARDHCNLRELVHALAMPEGQ